jgi:hypothetical protein
MTTPVPKPTPTTKPKGPSLRADVMTVLSAILTIVAVFHPGFHLPVPVQTVVSTIFAAGTVVFQLLGIHLRAKL